MTNRSIRIACSVVLAIVFAGGSDAFAQNLSLQFSGLPASGTCTTTQVNVGPGMTVAWNLTATTQVLTTITANGNVVKQNVKPLPSAAGSTTQDGITTFSNPVPMPYTFIYSVTPQLPGATTSAASLDCVGGIATNFKVWNGASFAPTAIPASLENPQIGAAESGIGLISGWACGVQSVQVSFDGAAKITVPYGAPRLDTASVCGAQTNSGYGLLFNYNTLGAGIHTATVYVNGNVIVASVPFLVNTPGGEFVTGADATINVGNFPVTGKAVTLSWQQATQNFTIASTAPTPVAVAGNYQGGFLGTATGCGSQTSVAMSNVQFAFTQTGDAVSFVMTMPGNTPSSCTFTGDFQYNVAGAQHSVQNGNYTCNDGTSGTWKAPRMTFTGEGGVMGLNPTTGSCVSQLRAGFVRTN